MSSLSGKLTTTNTHLNRRLASDMRNNLSLESQQTNPHSTQSIEPRDTTQMQLAIPRPMDSTSSLTPVEIPAAKLLHLWAKPTTGRTRLPGLELLFSKLFLYEHIHEHRASSDLVRAIRECSAPFNSSLQGLAVAQAALHQITGELHLRDDPYKQRAGLQERARMLLSYFYSLKIRIEIARTRHVQRCSSNDSVSWSDFKPMILEATEELDSMEDNVKELKQGVTLLERDWSTFKRRHV